MKPTIRYIAPLLVLGIGLAAYAVLHYTKPEPDKRQEMSRPVTVFVDIAKRGPVQLDVVTAGEVRSRAQIDLVAQVSGRIVEVSDEFTEGGAVLPDTPLLNIEDTDYQLALKQAQARVAEATVAVELSLADADVARKQLRNSPNPSDLALKKPQVAETRARLQAAEADLQQAHVNLSRTRVTAPFRGRMDSTYVDIGQFVTAGTPLGRAFATDRVEVRLPITDSQLASLDLPIGYVAPTGDGLDIDFSAEVARQSQLWRGKLVRLDASIDSTTRLLYAIAEVDDPYGSNASETGMPMAIGLYVNAVIHGREVTDAIRIPRKALRAGNTVFVVADNSRLDIRNVKVLHSSPQFAVIGEGLQQGEQYIISTIRNPIPGMALQAKPRGDGAIAASPATDTGD